MITDVPPMAKISQEEIFGPVLAVIKAKGFEDALSIATKAGVKLLIPLVFFIFPMIFVVALGPAIIALHKLFSETLK